MIPNFFLQTCCCHSLLILLIRRVIGGHIFNQVIDPIIESGLHILSVCNLSNEIRIHAVVVRIGLGIIPFFPNKMDLILIISQVTDGKIDNSTHSTNKSSDISTWVAILKNSHLLVVLRNTM